MNDKRHIRKEAVALSYEPNLAEAPKVVAKGKGKIAENILEKARANDVPIQEDPSLVEILGQLNLNESIPDELYKAVSEVFAYIYQLDREHGLKKRL
ncbi:EscU/YscU/HrcU family type III secretion system export apparatus switch protein [Sporosarcina limicola]|uniref:Flagellar biosynthesis protein n=1 Tax=Sporosarcina limicola TaxID=34101 RepID=A0A927ML06_9BACL|nr:EscU/YscU/HrcU family type III secretion system export apparatus switch protein [Sporosarcina limicola]MBE1553479.1 flagellar biosynthesis protein [Sporosarcina limicola]